MLRRNNPVSYAVFIILLVLAGCSEPTGEQESKIQSIDVENASTLLDQGKALFVDVREQSEWDQNHIPGAIHIPIAQLKSRLSELDGNQSETVIMYCHSGVRSAQGSVILKAAGFKDIHNMDGGMVEWNKKGLAIEK